MAHKAVGALQCVAIRYLLRSQGAERIPSTADQK